MSDVRAQLVSLAGMTPGCRRFIANTLITKRFDLNRQPDSLRRLRSDAKKGLGRA